MRRQLISTHHKPLDLFLSARIWLKDSNDIIKRGTRVARGIAMKLLQASCLIMAFAAGAAESVAESASPSSKQAAGGEGWIQRVMIGITMCAVMFVAGKRAGAAASASSSSRHPAAAAELLETDDLETTDGGEEISEKVVAETINAVTCDTIRCYLRTRQGTVLSGNHAELVEAAMKEMRK